ncbi:MAG: UDP-N-acetylmuramoylalanine--D-glutamate ligase, partial [Cognaticolwellia sp.]
GNIGKSFAKQVVLTNPDFYVLEISSFQLDYCFRFQPNIGILLNITPDHLDRYDYKMSNYVDSKFRLIQNFETENFFIFNNENESMVDWLKANEVHCDKQPIANVNYENDSIKVDDYEFQKSDLTIRGPHNHFNASCAIAVAKYLNIGKVAILKGLKTFQNVPHRMEYIRTLNGVDYINDTKATNVDAVKYALMAMEKSIVWIVGGQDKGNDYEEIMSLVKEKVRVMICLCADTTKLAETFPWLYNESLVAKTAEAAAEMALNIAKSGEVVLLSPACASFDLFDNYAQRGDFFRTAVNELI